MPHTQQLSMVTKRGLAVALACLLITLLYPAEANSSQNCRQIARDVQSDGLVATTTDSSGQATVKVFTDAVTAYPECEPELQILWQWNQARDPNSPFPFAKSDDPVTYPLGPISWWWDVIYNKLFDKNILLMVMFGWELFLLPFPFVFALVFLPIRLIYLLLKRLATKNE